MKLFALTILLFVIPLTASHRDTASELLLLVNAQENTMAGVSGMADVMIQGNPMLAPYRDVLIDWANQTMVWENMREPLLDIYVQLYTESELRELISFYRTPVGHKTVKITPEIARRSMLIGSNVAAEHTSELEVMIQKRSKELEPFKAPEQ